MRLYCEEVKKAFKSKRTWIILIMVLMIQVVSIIPDYISFKDKCGSVSKYNEYAEQYNNQISEKFVKQEDIKSMQNEPYIGSNTSIETIFHNQYLAAVCRSISWKETKGEENAPVFWNSIGVNKLIQNLNSY